MKYYAKTNRASMKASYNGLLKHHLRKSEETMTDHIVWNGFQRGVNLGGWFSQCDYSEHRMDTFIVHDDIRRIADWGLDHVRLPVDYNVLLKDDGTWNEAGFQRILNVIRWCHECGLHIVLDLHKTMGFSFDKGEAQSGFFENPALQKVFYDLWETLAKRLGAYHGMLAFELLNEVTEREYAVAWNRISKECVSRIRVHAPKVPILLGGYWNNSIDALEDLPAPYDAEIIYNFHCYDPIVFTHQGAPWVEGMNHDFRISVDRPLAELKEQTQLFLGKETHEFDELDLVRPLGADYFIRKFEKAARIARERHVRLYCGEYGVIDRASPQDIIQWYRYIHEAFLHYGIGHAAWSYREMDFGIADERMDRVRDQLIRLL